MPSIKTSTTEDHVLIVGNAKAGTVKKVSARG
jgi:hypothetical protein